MPSKTIDITTIKFEINDEYFRQIYCDKNLSPSTHLFNFLKSTREKKHNITVTDRHF